MDKNYTTAFVGTSAAINTPVRETEINKIMSRLENLTKYLHESTDKLENRLMSVLSSPSKDIEERAQDPEYVTAHGKRISSVVTTLENLGRRLENLTRQVEL